MKVVITDCLLPDTGIERAVLAELSAEVVRAACKTPEDVIAAAHDADAVMVQWAPIPAHVIERLERCRIISRYGIGVDMIDVEAAASHGIRVVANSEYCIEEVAQHALALLLGCSRKLAPAMAALKAGNWNKKKIMQPLAPLSEQTLGLVGLGRIGRLLARRAAPLVGRILAFDPYVSQDAVPEGVWLVRFEELLRESDYISIHCPLTESTRGLFDATALRSMKPTAWLINTARAPLVDEQALVSALREGTIGGAALDVFHTEPLPVEHPLASMPNVLATPHVAWYSERALQLLQENTARAVVDYFREAAQAAPRD
jgi:D-3-phosphoglycerate dehydrogenase